MPPLSRLSTSECSERSERSRIERSEIRDGETERPPRISLALNPGYGLTGRSFDQLDDRLPFLDGIRGELRRVAATDVLRRVDRSGRDEQDIAGLEGHRRLALYLIFPQVFDDIDDLLARMAVRGERLSCPKIPSGWGFAW